MVREEQFEPRDELEPIGRITLKPNQSLSWKALRIFLICFALLSGSIAIAFLFLGYWIILPLAGAEFLIVSLCLWLCLKRSAIQEVITFSKSRIKIEKGSDVPSESYHWERFYTKLLVESSTSSLHRNRIWLSHKNSKSRDRVIPHCHRARETGKVFWRFDNAIRQLSISSSGMKINSSKKREQHLLVRKIHDAWLEKIGCKR